MVRFLNNYCSICGTLHSVDQYHNFKLIDISVTDPEKHPHLVIIYIFIIYNSYLLKIVLSEVLSSDMFSCQQTNVIQLNCKMLLEKKQRLESNNKHKYFCCIFNFNYFLYMYWWSFLIDYYNYLIVRFVDLVTLELIFCELVLDNIADIIHN